MKIRSVAFNNRKRAFEVKTSRSVLSFPYAKADPPPSADEPVVEVEVEEELGREGFSYTLKSKREGTVHIDQVLEYNRDPSYLRDLLLYKLTLEAQRRVRASGLSRREITRGWTHPRPNSTACWIRPIIESRSISSSDCFTS